MGTKVDTDGFQAEITTVNSFSGDCDVTQRKGKVLCIYDMQLAFASTGNVDGEDISFTILIPEFVHDQDEDEYVFEISETPHKVLIRKHFVPVLLKVLQAFQNDLISAHETSVQHQTN